MASSFECTPSFVSTFCVCVRRVCLLIPRSSAIFSGGVPVRHALEDLQLARREPFDALREVAVGGAAAAQLPQGFLDLGAGVEGLAPVGAPDRVGQAAHGLGLAQVPAGSRLDRAGE